MVVIFHLYNRCCMYIEVEGYCLLSQSLLLHLITPINPNGVHCICCRADWSGCVCDRIGAGHRAFLTSLDSASAGVFR